MCGFTLRKSVKLEGPLGYLRHRGPDEQSYFSGEGYELEFSRLTITGTIDGEVPVYSSSKEWLVAFNGEIYNFNSLKESFGLGFTNSDTKVIAEGLEKFGLQFLKSLRGMYAGIAINTRTKSTFVFRDPLGEKPLFYSKTKSQLVISSEFTALMKTLNKPFNLNPKAVADYFRFGYVEEPDTFDSEIFAVKRGAVLEIIQDNNFIEVMALIGYADSEISLDLNELLDVVNKEVTFSTVPTGLALSAGVDSTSILFAMSKYRGPTFIPLILNINREGMSTEASEAINACKKMGVKPHVIQIPAGRELLINLKNLAISNDQPHSDPSGLSYLSIFQAAQSCGLKVVLLGHGPDEMFWGYPWFNSQLQKTQRALFPRKASTREFWNNPASSKRLLCYLGNSSVGMDRDFSTDPFLRTDNLWQKYRAELVHSYLSSNGLRQSDRLAMASGVEPRTPYADSRLYGWAQNRSKHSIDTFDKVEFRKAIELGPLEDSRFRAKQGFNSPMGEWFENTFMRDFVGDNFTILLKSDIRWRVKPKLEWMSPSEKYKIIMLGAWISQFN